jgi:hypothetical protein
MLDPGATVLARLGYYCQSRTTVKEQRIVCQNSPQTGHFQPVFAPVRIFALKEQGNIISYSKLQLHVIGELEM